MKSNPRGTRIQKKRTQKTIRNTAYSPSHKVKLQSSGSGERNWRFGVDQDVILRQKKDVILNLSNPTDGIPKKIVPSGS